MKFFTRVAVLFYVSLVMVVCCLVSLFLLNMVSLQDTFILLQVIYTDESLQTIVAGVVCVLLLINYLVYRGFSVNTRKEKIIAFDNPSGRVSVSLFALEDLVKRMLAKMSEVKEARSGITVSKKGLYVKIRITLCSEVNIPEITSRVQEMVKSKIQDTIGIDEPVNVAIYVGKIIPMNIKDKREDKEEEQEKLETNIPFQGYRA